ncbi:MAG: DUF6543 domain-containing protein [Pseudomonas sp.]|uniref:dermonecrotic toxin domain-containing protein n=1 Tax=Pseudomonas sp. TaxID=306 RepID=UPI003C77B093
MLTENTPIHFDFIKQQLPAWLPGASEQRLNALKQLQPNIPERFLNPPSPAYRRPFKQAIDRHWASQNAVDKKLAHLNDVKAFAIPLLKNALSNYGDIDVVNTSIRLYAPIKLPWWAINQQPGVTARTTTLVEAALHNFSASETFVDYAFLSQEDARGQREQLRFTHRVTAQALTADTFKTLCRHLNIGARYLQHLKAALGFDNPSVAIPLQQAIIGHLKAGLNSAAQLALARKDIGEDSYTLIQTLLQRDGPLQLGGETVDFYTLDLLDTRLTGILVIAPVRLDATAHRLLVYIPEDPAHPLKEYASAQAFIKELTGRLRDRTPGTETATPSYQQFFSQFVAHDQRGRFFYELNSRLSIVRWHEKEPGDNRPSWRPDPVEVPKLRFQTLAIRDDTPNRIKDPYQNNLWHYLYRVKLNKLVNDAREIAISTDYADRMARWEWWDNLEKMLSDIFNAALLVTTPFVPLLGELMLAYTAYQMLDDVFEGIVDWAEGLQQEGWEHLLSVAQSAVQLGLFESGASITKTAKVKLSSFVDQLLLVQGADAQTRLWSPDLKPYQHSSLPLPENHAPGENGLHRHQGKHIANLENKRYEVRQDPITQGFHLAHPKRANAYQPQVALNGSGACVIKGEQPRTWSNSRLLRRLGPQTHGFSMSELEQARLVSGVDFGALRHMYVNNTPTPPLLADTLKRMKIAKQVESDVASIRASQPLDPASDWFEQMVTELDGWPKEKALLVYPKADLSGTPRRYGNATAQGHDALAVSIADVMSGKLPEKVIGFLDEPQRYVLLGDALPAQEQVPALRKRLADHVQEQSELLSRDLYARQEATDSAEINLLRSHYPELPLSIAQRLVSHARRRNLNVMVEEKRVPLDVKNQARELNFEAAGTRMFEQIHQGKTPSVDTENLALNTLRIHSDAFSNLRIQVRERTPSGDLRNQVGAEDAADLKVLVRNRKGQYRVFNSQGMLVHGATDFYSALYQALPNGTHFTDGNHLRSWLTETTKTPAQRRMTLAEPPIRPRADRETLTLLGGGNSSTMRGMNVQVRPVTLQGRIKHWLPAMSDAGVRHFAQNAETPEGLAKLEQVEREGSALETALDTYVRSTTQWPQNSRLEAVTQQRRALFADRVMNAWREGYTQLHDPVGSAEGTVNMDLTQLDWPDKLPMLPIDLGLVTHLDMSNSGFTSKHAHFLLRVPNLQALDLSSNALEELPVAVANMHSLKELNLSGNRIALNETGSEQLRGLSRLRSLDLSNNRLGRAPNISRMPDLELLDLSHTGLNEWPVGLFAHARDERFVLHLQGNSITTVPEVAKDSDEALVVACTRLDRSMLAAEARDLFDEYKIAWGLDPLRTYPPKGEADFWIDDLDDDNQHRYRTIWNELEKEPGSQGFFEVLKKLEPPEFFEDAQDETRYYQNKAILAAQGRYMLASMHEDPALRRTLFQMSSFPGLCPDAGSQIFTEMGIQVEARGAQLYSRTPGEREDQLAKLARGAARLALLKQVARADIAHRLQSPAEGGLGLRLTSQVMNGEPGTVDEVEVHLAYQTRLANKLQLPWVSSSMAYRATADVPEANIAQAQTAVQTLSEGDGLVNQMLLEPYWEAFLKEHYAHDYAANEEHSAEQLMLFEDLDSEQKAFADAKDLNEEQINRKRQDLKKRVAQLQIGDRVDLDHVMPEALYDQIYNDLAERRKEWLREQTRLSLARLED